MERYTVAIFPTRKQTRVILCQGEHVLMRASLPPPESLRHEQAVTTMLEGLALWLDTRLHVVLCVDAERASFCLGLTDELARGLGSIFFTVEVERLAPRRRERARARSHA
jgi:hypothetical protein